MPVRFQYDFDKFLAIVLYMAEKVPELDTYKVLKLLFLADKYHLVRFARPITGDRYAALEYGPVASQSFDLIKQFTAARKRGNERDDAVDDVFAPPPIALSKQVLAMLENLDMDMRFRYPRFLPKSGPEFSHLSKSDLMALDHVIERFGPLGFNELKSITHSVFAYRKTWAECPMGWMDFEDFFEEDADAIEGARELMLENAEISESFPSIDAI